MKKQYLIAALLLASIVIVWLGLRRRSATPTPLGETITVGTNAEYQPFTFVKNGERVGFDIDIAMEVCKRLDKDMILKDMAFAALIPGLQMGSLQFVAAGMTPTEQRAKRVLFTRPYLEGDTLLVVTLSKNPPLKTFSDLNGKEVIVNEGYVSETYMSTKKGPILRRLQNPVQGFAALTSGQGYAFVVARSIADAYLKEHGRDKFNVFPIADTANRYALAVSKKYPKLRDQIQTILDQMEADGTLTQLKKKWGLLTPQATTS